jgi:ATP-binding cassette subfamily F protein 3
MEGVAKSYGENLVFEGVKFLIERGDRIGLVGVNGAGKSTLMKLLAGVETLSAGEYVLGHNAEPNYFAQDQYRELDGEATLVDDLATVAPAWTTTQLRSLLGCFLFSDEEADKKLGVLSGGERNRYALARLLVSPSNFLLLDEPTNHLDMRAKDVLLRALESYTGTVIFVSHDRYFIDQLATRIIEVADSVVTLYPGNYEDYLRQKEGAALAAESGSSTGLPVPTLSDVPGFGDTEAGKQKRINPIRLKQMEARSEEVEEEVALAEASIAELEKELAVFKSTEELIDVTEALDRQRQKLDRLMAEWEELTSTLSDSSA